MESYLIKDVANIVEEYKGAFRLSDKIVIGLNKNRHFSLSVDAGLWFVVQGPAKYNLINQIDYEVKDSFLLATYCLILYHADYDLTTLPQSIENKRITSYEERTDSIVICNENRAILAFDPPKETFFPPPLH